MGDGRRIQAAREAAGLTQVQLASILGRSPSTVHRWEVGASRPQSGVLERRIAEALGVPADSIFHDPEADSASTARGENVIDGAGRDSLGHEVAATGAQEV